MTLVALDRVACVRRERLLFEGLSLALAAGEARVVAGPNGVGKSSLLRIAAGLLRPSAGRVRRTGAAGWLGEAAALDGERPLGHALAFWARLDGAGDRIAAAMADMGVDGLAQVPVRYLSTGQRRRAALARVIAGRCPLWLLDEPVNGLDADGVARLGAAMAAHRARGGAILAASHVPLPLDADTMTLAP